MLFCPPAALRAILQTLMLIAALSTAGPAFAAAAGKVVLSVGEVRIAGVAAKAGDDVPVGAPLQTGEDGYLYIKTIDNGFLILRPGSAATIAEYRIDTAQPGESRFRIELDKGLARHITGDAVKNARQNFRFNTPVAAIGVRGTDFTAYTDDRQTRVAVVAGGVVVNAFGEGCNQQGAGPCEGAGALELFAGQPGLLLVEKAKGAPRLLEQGSVAPEGKSPPRSDEPIGSQSALRGAPSEANLDPLKTDRVADGAYVPDVPAERPAIQWGRWQTVAGEAAPNLPLVALLGSHTLAAFNPYFALLRPNDMPWDNRIGGAVDFRLQGAQALVALDAGGTRAATVENARLRIDFGQSSFATGFDLVTEGQRFVQRAEGRVFANGSFENINRFQGNNNMAVNGIIGQDQQLRAAYLFQGRLDDGRVAYGVTAWAK